LILTESARWIRDDSRFGLLRFFWMGRPDLTSSDAPPRASLVSTLREALQERAVTLEEVSAEMKRQSLALSRQFPGLQYEGEFTPSFNGLILGGP
jgi:hypothetical protein